MAHFVRETGKTTQRPENSMLDVWLYKPLSNPPFPVIICEAGLAIFGEKYDAGYASLVFDYHFFGDSDGKPRDLTSLKNISGMSGLNVAQLALEDSGLAGVISHLPMLEYGFTYETVMPLDTIKGRLGLSLMFLRCAGRTDRLLQSTPLALIQFPSGFQMIFTQAPDIITLRIALQFMGRCPALKINKTFCPSLIVIAKEDDLLSPQIARVTLVEAPGGRFDIMAGGQGFSTNIKAQIKLLRSLI
ncbi:alpha/beta-hydrolase [Mycena floridula]|nr:alpha/beta-hydrolase [Mycena floridula]